MAAIVDDRRSRLNPNAPVFVPNAAFCEVEDFSPEWWDLVKTSPWFREYWLSQHHEDDFIGGFDGYDYGYLELEEFLDIDDADQLVESKETSESASNKGREPLNGLKSGMDAKSLLKNLNLNLDLNVTKFSKGRGAKSPVIPGKYCEKKLANKIVMSPKCTASRRIHQPR